MEYLFHLITARIARLIESGSACGALLGMLVGAGLLFLIWMRNASSFEPLQDFNIGGYLLAIIAGGIFGALVGGRITRSRIPIPNEFTRELVLSRYNEALAPVVACLVFLILAVVVPYSILFVGKPGNPEAAKWLAIGTGTLFSLLSIYLSLISIRQIFEVRLGEQITLRRLFGSENITNDKQYVIQLTELVTTTGNRAKSVYLTIFRLTNPVIEIQLKSHQQIELKALIKKYKHSVRGSTQ